MVLVSIRVLHKRIIAVNDANIVRHIMVTHHQRYRRSYHYDNPVLGQGLLSTDGPPGKNAADKCSLRFGAKPCCI